MTITNNNSISKPRARYSIYVEGLPFTEDEWDIRHTKRNVIAIDGPVRVVGDGDTFLGSGATFRDRVLESPTYGSLHFAATRMMRATGDFHHSFFEGFKVVGVEQTDKYGEVKILRLVMGS